MNSLGKAGESFIKNLLEKSGITCEKSEYDNRYDHDFACKFGRTKFSIEVKHDKLAFSTGNLAIEIMNTKSNTPSGLTVTKADIWCVVLSDFENLTAWFVKTDVLRGYVNGNKPVKVVEFGGDKNAKLMLYRVEDILPLFKQVDTLGEEDLKKLIRTLL